VALSQHVQLLDTSSTLELLVQAKKSLLRRTAKEALLSSHKFLQPLLQRPLVAAEVEVAAPEQALEEVEEAVPL
jgi:hypothetical protein